MDNNYKIYSTNNTINEKLDKLEEVLLALSSKVKDLSNNVEENTVKPYSKVGGGKDQSQVHSIDIKTGLGQKFGGSIIWNDSELTIPPYGVKPPTPIRGYNKHSHSNKSGGALDINTLEIVEYDVDWDTSIVYDKDCQNFWLTAPMIKKEINDKEESVEKIGTLDLIFNANNKKWGTACYEIDVKKCYLVSRDADGEIELDENGNEKKALLYNEDETKTNVIWDKSGKCWRFYSAFAEAPEE